MNILVTGVGGDIGQSVVRCLREAVPSARLIGCDIDPYAPGSVLVDRFELVPRAADADYYLQRIAEIVKMHKVSYVFPITDSEIDVFDQHRKRLRNTIVLIINPFALSVFLDKYKTVLHLERHGLHCPRSFRVEDFTNQLDYPFLIKARRGWGGRGLIEIQTSEEFAFHRSRVSNAIVQEIVGTADEEYTVGVFSDGKNTHSINFRRYLGYGNLSKFVELVHDEELDRIARVVASSCDLRGPLNVQLRKTSEGYMPFEVNARISSTVYFRHCFGFQDVKWWLNLLEGESIEYKPRYRKGIGVRVISEAFFDLEEVV